MDRYNEDEDIRIAGAEDDDADTDAEAEREAAELLRQRETGNLDRARALGAQLARALSDMDGAVGFGQDARETPAVRAQRRLLFAFTVAYAIDEFVPGQVLQDVTLGMFYEALEENMPAFYGELDGSGAFTFYWLCVRNGGNVAAEIGRRFAMLASQSGDAVVEGMGEALFLRFCDEIKAVVGSAGFVA